MDLDRREINRNLAAQLKAKLNFDETETFDHVKVDEEQNEENDSSRTTSNHHGEFCLLFKDCCLNDDSQMKRKPSKFGEKKRNGGLFCSRSFRSKKKSVKKKRSISVFVRSRDVRIRKTIK